MSQITEHDAIRLPVLDEPWHRLPAVVGVSIVLWVGLLVIFGLLLTQLPSAPDAVEARLVYLPAKGLAGGGGGSPLGSRATAAPEIATAPLVGKLKPKNQHTARSTHAMHFRDSAPAPIEGLSKAPVAHPMNSDSSNAASNSAPESNPAPELSKIAVRPGEGGVGSGTGTGIGNGVARGSGTGAGGGFGSGGSGPEAIYAPTPTIPDDMRDEVLEAVAVARFQVSARGQVLVSLTRPTDFSRLNDVILETLRTWRFHPASRNGVAIDSDAEIRLLITVQ